MYFPLVLGFFIFDETSVSVLVEQDWTEWAGGVKVPVLGLQGKTAARLYPFTCTR